MEHGNWKSMYEAACGGDLELVKYYVNSGVDVNYVHPEFMSTALVSCIVADQSDVAVYLLDNGADPNIVSPWEDMTPVQAVATRNLPAVQARIDELAAATR